MDTTELASSPEWNTSRLIKLIGPLIIDQILIVLIGIVDTVMVASLGETAVGGVSLVDSLNVVILSLFISLTTGGAVVCSQYLGRQDPENASNGAKQLFYLSITISLIFSFLMFFLRMSILRVVYGHIEEAVMTNAGNYFYYTALSYPFIAISTAGAAVFRSMGNSKVGMWTSLLINVLNFLGNFLLIYVLNLGVAGAAISTLISRIVAAVLLLILLKNSKGPINIRGIHRVRIMPSIIKSILRVTIPHGLEGGSFQIGKLALARLVSMFGTAAIAGNALGNIFMTIGNLPGVAIGHALLIVVGQYMGAGDFEGVRHQTHRLMILNYIVMIAYNSIILLSMPLIFRLFGQSMSPESLAYGRLFGTIFCTAVMIIWIPAYCLPHALRAAGDGPYVFVVSAIAMWFARVGIAYLLAYAFGVGAVCVWISMVCEWTLRAAGYFIRWRRGKWQEQKVI